MKRNLAQATGGYVIQGALSLKAREHSLHSWPLSVQSLPGQCILPHTAGEHCLLMGTVGLDNRFRSILTFYQGNQLFGRIPCVSHEKARSKLTGSVSSLLKNVGGPSHIMDVACTDICPDRKLRFAIHNEVEFIPVGSFFNSLSTLLHAPSCVGVGLLRLTTVAPAFKSSAVQGYPLTESWDFIVAATYQSAGHILQLSSHLVLGEPSEETAKGGVMRYGIGRFNPTGLGNKGVVAEFAPKSLCRGQSQDVLSYDASPEDGNRVAFRTAAGRANKGFQKGFIIQSLEDTPKLCDDGRRLRRCAKDDSIGRGHRMLTPSFRSGVVSVSPPTTPYNLRTNVSHAIAKVNRKWRTFVTNSNEFVTKDNPYTLFDYHYAPYGWLPGWDSNPHSELDRQVCYRYTTWQCVGADGSTLRVGRRPCFWPIKKTSYLPPLKRTWGRATLVLCSSALAHRYGLRLRLLARYSVVNTNYGIQDTALCQAL